MSAPVRSKDEVKRLIAARVAKELRDGDFVNLGIGLPTLIPDYLPEGVEITVHAEDGIIGAGPRPGPDFADPEYVIDAGSSPASVMLGGAFIDSVSSFALIRGGHLDVTVLGALQVDQEGNLANWIIPGKMVPGMGGAMDLVAGAKRVIIAMEHTQKGTPKILRQCTLPLTAARCVDLIITELGVFDVTEHGLVLTEVMPGVSVEDVRAATEADFEVAADLHEVPA